MGKSGCNQAVYLREEGMSWDEVGRRDESIAKEIRVLYIKLRIGK
jgi:hypothetical protein